MVSFSPLCLSLDVFLCLFYICLSCTGIVIDLFGDSAQIFFLVYVMIYLFVNFMIIIIVIIIYIKDVFVSAVTTINTDIVVVVVVIVIITSSNSSIYAIRLLALSLLLSYLSSSLLLSLSSTFMVYPFIIFVV